MIGWDKVGTMIRVPGFAAHGLGFTISPGFGLSPGFEFGFFASPFSKLNLQYHIKWNEVLECTFLSPWKWSYLNMCDSTDAKNVRILCWIPC